MLVKIDPHTYVVVEFRNIFWGSTVVWNGRWKMKKDRREKKKMF